MSKLRYIGSKVRLTQPILSVLGGPLSAGRFIDAFCGTGVVSAAAADAGWSILANDTLISAVISAAARLVSVYEVPFEKFGSYERAICDLNATEEIEGFFYREYSPSGANSQNVQRPYFTVQNARKIDAIRSKIRGWADEGAISNTERMLLLADLMAAANQVANIAGTYGCFLREFTASAKRRMDLTPRTLHWSNRSWAVSIGDALKLNARPEDVVYLDPPYTKRQYAAYYHILETIAHEDEPNVSGVTGLRPWEHNASPFCYKKTAAAALEELLARMPARRILVSYSSDGHISFDAIRAILSSHGNVSLHEFRHFARYTPNEESLKRAATTGLTEYLFDVRRG